MNEELSYRQTKGLILKVLRGLLSWKFPETLQEGNNESRELNLSLLNLELKLKLLNNLPPTTRKTPAIPYHTLSGSYPGWACFFSLLSCCTDTHTQTVKETDLLRSSAKVNTHIANAINRLVICCPDGHGGFHHRHLCDSFFTWVRWDSLNCCPENYCNSATHGPTWTLCGVLPISSYLQNFFYVLKIYPKLLQKVSIQ